ncbi:MAG: hypothetical protein Q7S96_02200 [bacterium]|nr:hypothetical protein [bacterium]
MRTFGARIMGIRVLQRTGRILSIAMACATVGVVLFLPHPASAQVLNSVTQGIAEIIGGLLSLLIWFVGLLFLAAVYVLTIVAQYNGFIDAPAVVTGWVIVRDVANMFFIVVLLIIAFATILNISSYKYQQMLPQLLIAAVLINFSKTIAGIFIDFSQVVTLTFVNGFAAAAGGNFASMFQIHKMFNVNPGANESLGGLKIVGGYLLGLFLMLMALAVVLVIIVILTFRIVMLWALVVLSPLPYLLRILPKRGQQYGNKWWDEFFNYLIVGPVLAFFLWLALTSLGGGEVAQSFRGPGTIGGSDAELSEFNTIGTESSGVDSLISFVVAMAMLVAGLKIAGESGVVGAGAANLARQKLASYGKRYAYNVSGARAVRSMAARGVQSDRAQKLLSKTAAMRIPLASGLATSGLMAVKGARKKREEDAAKRIGVIKNVRDLGRTVQPKGVFGKATAAISRLGASGYYEQQEAQKRLPSAIADAGARGKAVHGMEPKDLQAMDVGELRRLSTMSEEEGGLTATQRLHLLERGSIGQQQAVGLRRGETSFRSAQRNYESDRYQHHLTAQPNTKAGQAEAKRLAREDAERDVLSVIAPRPRIDAGLTDESDPNFMNGKTRSDVMGKEQSGTIMDEGRYETTRQAIARSTGGSEDAFYRSPEYKNNKQDYYDQRQYSTVKKSYDQQRKAKDERGRNRVSGVASLTAQAREAPGGALPTATLLVRFEDIPELRHVVAQEDHTVTDPVQKTALMVGMEDAMETDGYERSAIDEAMLAVRNASVLHLRNTGTEDNEAASRLAVIREAVRQQLTGLASSNPTAFTNLESEMRRIVPTLTAQMQTALSDPALSDADAMKEYVARALANSQLGRATDPQTNSTMMRMLARMGLNVNKTFKVSPNEE